MKNSESIKAAINELVKHHLLLKDKGGPNADGNYFEEVLSMQDDILKSFGLPKLLEYEKLLWFEKAPTEIELENLINVLHEKANDYLTREAKPASVILKEAQEQGLNPGTVLPELNIATHTYTYFVYNNILLDRRDTIENVLQELTLVNEFEILDTIGRLKQNMYDNPEEKIQYLKEKGLRYIDDFMDSLSDFIQP